MSDKQDKTPNINEVSTLNESKAGSLSPTELNATLNLLYEKFPKCFVQGRDKKPLQVGISKILLESLEGESVSEQALKKCFGSTLPNLLIFMLLKKGLCELILRVTLLNLSPLNRSPMRTKN